MQIHKALDSTWFDIGLRKRASGKVFLRVNQLE